MEDWSERKKPIIIRSASMEPDLKGKVVYSVDDPNRLGVVSLGLVY